MSDPPSKPQDPTSAIEGVGAAQAPKRSEQVDDLHGVDPSRATDGAPSVEGIASESDLALAEALSTGAVDPVRARERLIDEVVRAQLPADAAPELVERVRAEIEALLGGDPTLATLLDPGR